MKKFLSLFAMAFLLSAVVPQTANAYDIAKELSCLSREVHDKLYREYIYTPPPGGFVNNDETEFNAIVFNDPALEFNALQWFHITDNKDYCDLWFSDYRSQQIKLSTLPTSSALTTSFAGKEPLISTGTSGQFYRGDKTWQTMNKAAVGLGNVDNTTDAGKPVSTATQTALDAKAALSHSHVANDISDATTTGKAVLISANAGAARTAIGAGTSSFSGAYSDLTGKPTLPTLPIAETDVTNLTADLSKRPLVYLGGTVKSNAKTIIKTATVASGNAVFYLTADETSTGTALCTNVYLDSLMTRAVEGTNPHAYGTPALSNGTKTLTVPVSKIAPILGILNVGQAANGSVISASIMCD